MVKLPTSHISTACRFNNEAFINLIGFGHFQFKGIVDENCCLEVKKISYKSLLK